MTYSQATTVRTSTSPSVTERIPRRLFCEASAMRTMTRRSGSNCRLAAPHKSQYGEQSKVHNLPRSTISALQFGAARFPPRSDPQVPLPIHRCWHLFISSLDSSEVLSGRHPNRSIYDPGVLRRGVIERFGPERFRARLEEILESHGLRVGAGAKAE